MLHFAQLQLQLYTFAKTFSYNSIFIHPLFFFVMRVCVCVPCSRHIRNKVADIPKIQGFIKRFSFLSLYVFLFYFACVCALHCAQFIIASFSLLGLHLDDEI